MMTLDQSNTPLSADWTVRAASGPVPDDVRGVCVPATVPGCATTDLLAAGVIPDPYIDDNELHLAWIGQTDWCFETAVELSPLGLGERLDLVCEGLDTLATIELNGTVVGRTANMHRSYRLDLRAAATAGTNHLRVTFDAPVPAAERLSRAIGPRPHVNGHPFNAIRKMACAYGWDWGPDLATSGIWRPVAVERWHTARLASVRPLVTASDLRDAGADGRPRRGSGRVELHVAVERAEVGADAVEVACRVGELVAIGVVPPGEATVTVVVEVPDVALWWPRGYGDQPLHQLDVELRRAAGGEVLDQWQRRIGFRSAALDVTPDQVGTAVALVVNGTTITARGVNWIPEDCFLHRVDRSRYSKRLGDAAEANVNLVRVWGGGIYETDDFYDVADELGLLVWQDFLFACAAYSEEEPLRSEVEAEAREAVTRLSPHPSLVAWNGCNENLWGREDWGWAEPLGDLTWGAGYYFDLLPAIVAELDPTRPYAAGSPWSYGADAHPNDWRHGTMHVWDVWNQRDYTTYADYRPRFVSEFGFQGPPAWSTLTRAVHDEPLRPDGPILALHQKAADGQDKLSVGLSPHLPEPTDFDAWHWATSLNQARAVAFAVERWRSIDPPCNGVIVWQLNDCWPVVSWAAVDGDGHRKPLWYALRRVFADRLLTLQPAVGGGVELVAVNDGGQPWTATVELTRQDFDGLVLEKGSVDIDVPAGARRATLLDDRLARPADVHGEVLAAGADGVRALRFWSEDKELDLPPDRPVVEVVVAGDGWDVTVRANRLLRDIAVLADKADPAATVDEMLVTLLAGESATFHVRSASLDPDRLAAAVRTANQLRHPTG